VSPVAQVRLLLVQSLREGTRNPLLAYALPIVIPLALLVLVATTLSRATELPGFPTDNYAAWITPPVVMLTAMTGVGFAATSLVIDIRSGFIDRLRLLDARPKALLLSRLLFDVLRVLFAGAVVLILGVVLGTEVNGGLVGLVMLFGLLMLWAAAYGGLYFVVALTTMLPQAPLALLAIAFPLAFLSTLFLPDSLLPRWAEVASRWNPYSYMVDASRVLITGPFSAAPVARAVAVALGVLLVTLVVSMRAFSRAVGAR
jgi:ABC-2 type transport system permease protein